MKIAIFTDTYEPQINGVVTSIKSYNEQLRKRGHEIHIFCPKDKGLKKSKFIHSLRSVDFKPYPTYKIGIPSPSILRKIKKIRPDIVHIQSPAPIGFLGLSAAKALRIPIVSTYHTLLTEYISYLPGSKFKYVRKLQKKGLEKYIKLFFNRSDIIIAPGIDTKKFLKKLVKKPIVILPTGIQIPKLTKKPKNKIPIILQVGRLCKERSVEVVVHAFNELLKTQQAKLIITSDGPQSNELKHLVKELEIQKHVQFTGFVSEQKKNSLYKKADMFVSASATDTQGLVPLEAMSFGTPVVVTHGPGFRDFITHNKNGLMFSPGKYKELSKQMIRILRNKKLKTRLSKNARKTAESYEISKFTNKLEAVYYHSIYNML
jgi:1,2-diacylglycerol 3-alpha-glucosyltransferase